MMNLHSALLIPRLILVFAGRWPRRNPSTFNRIREAFFNLMEVIFSLLLIAEVYILFKDFDFDVFFDLMAGIITSTAHLFKIVLFKMKSRVILEVLDQLDSAEFNNYQKKFSDVNVRHVKFARNFGNLFQFGCCLSSAGYILAPIWSDIDLPLQCSLIPKEYIPYFYVWQSFVIVLCALTHSSVDVVFTDLIGISVGQLSVLIEEIKSIDETVKETELNEFVIHHVEIIRFVRNLDKAVSGIIAIEYCKSALIVCFLGIQAVNISPVSAPFVRISIYGVVMVIQLIIYCFFANEILMKSGEIENACLHCKWYNIKHKYKKTLILIMERSKRPLTITAGIFSTVSLESFKQIMKSSYTYFALMQTLYSKETTH